MNPDLEAIERARWLVATYGPGWNEQLSLRNFGEFAVVAADTVRGMTPKQRAGLSWLNDWAYRFAALADDRDRRVKADPLLLYTPRSPKHAAVHNSPAFIRYMMAANTVGKTLLAYVENIWCATGQQHWKGLRGHVSVVSTGHTVYSEKVFVTKMVVGEDADPLSPYIPEGGYWFHSFDQRKYLLRVACPDCAAARKPRDCTHTRSIQCLSADSGMERLMGFTQRMIQIDEHIAAEVYREMRQRLRRGPNRGRMMVTATPLAGPDSWEIQELYNLWKDFPERNWMDMTTKTEPFVEVFNISKFDCVGTPGGPTLGEIESERATYPDSEFRVRVLGEPVPLADDPVFDIDTLDKMEKEEARTPDYYLLAVKPTEPGQPAINLETLQYGEDVLPVKIDPPQKPHDHTGFRVWKLPQEGKRYVIGVDTASGTGVSNKRRDASAAYVFEVMHQDDKTIKFDMVACFWGYSDVWSYAANIKLLGYWYNMALVIPEVNGIGMAFAQDLARRLSYPNIYVGENSAALLSADVDSKLGVVTSAQSKPLMAEALKVYIKSRLITMRDKFAIAECRAFQQTLSESGRSYIYEAAPGMHDDRVLAMAFVAYAALYQPVAVAQMSIGARKKPKAPEPRFKRPSERTQRKRFI